MSIEEFARAIIDFVRTHEAWAAPIVFVLAFGESLAFVSLLLPAWAALVGIGALIGAGGLDFVPFWIGAKFKTSIANVWPLSRHPQLLPRGEAFIKKWGVLAIFIARFSGPLRASVPIVAGIFGMPYWQFQIANFSSAFIWAATLLLLGDVTSRVLAWLWGL